MSPDGVDPGYDVCNNTHTATLEDFGLSDLDSNGNSVFLPPGHVGLRVEIVQRDIVCDEIALPDVSPIRAQFCSR